ncbi:pantoate--beta-alanine ligase [Pollutibacter soli]|uniref:pantoate--beta-alanine ligase n=1 Tax=Pollutibacter soli TaxID=3034157 RepID=UPI0030138A98
MIIHSHISPLQQSLENERFQGKTIGFVPTMGALHEGHLRLIDASNQASDVTVCSIFVNPKQFNDPKDFEKYPNRIGADLEMLYAREAAAVFIPAVDEMYPPGVAFNKTYDLGGLDTRMEGAFRPGHFQGVCQVMDRLLHIVNADLLFMGQKDFQQCLVIRKLLEITGLKTKLEIFPTVRETSGLAMSSRNMRLSAEQKEQATLIYKILMDLKNDLRPGDLASLKRSAISELTNGGFKVDYVEIADTENLNPIHYWDGKQKAVAVVAAFLGEVRLIDNMLL